MEINIKDTDNFESGAFILNESRVPFNPFQRCSTVFLTEENNDLLRKEILKIIAESKEVLKICSFILTDNEVFEAILNKSLNTDTAIFILTQLDQGKLVNSDFLTEEEINQNASQLHLNYLTKLFDTGVHVRASLSAHAKFIVSDRKIGFITSANLTTPSLTINTESGVYLDGISTLELDRLFDVIFQQGTSYRQFIRSSKSNKMFIVQTALKIDNRLLPNSSFSNLRYTYEDKTHNLFEAILGIINTASKFLYISTYSIVGLEQLPEFTFAIHSAVKRNVQIFVFCRGMNYRYDHLSGSGKLYSLGCKIYANMYNHSKGIINEKSGLIFTANIDGFHGLKNGFELGYLLNDTQRFEFLEIHRHLVKTGTYYFQDKPSRIQLFKSYLNYELSKGIKPPQFPNDLIILIKKGLQIEKKELEGLPLFFGRSKNTEYLIAGNSYYQCRLKVNTFSLIARDSPHFDLEKYIIKYHNLKLIFDQ